MKQPMRQFKLATGSATLVTYLPEDRRLRVGTRLTLKDSDDPRRWWTVIWRSVYVRDRKSIRTDWDNNI